MYFTHVQTFVAVAECKSFSKAAKKMYISQPTISSHIKALESSLGVQLIARTTKDIVLSDAGRMFYDYAKQIIHIRDEAYRKMQTYSDEVRGHLQIAAAMVSAQYFLPAAFCEIREKHPDIFLTVLRMDSEDVIRKVESLDVEIGITGVTVPDSQCVFYPFMCDQLVLIAPNTERYQKMNGVFPIEQLAREPFVWRKQKDTRIRKNVENFLESNGVVLDSMNVVAEFPTVESVKEAVRNNLGVSIVNRSGVKDYIKFGYLLEFNFDSELVKQFIYIVYQKNRMLSPAAECFFEYFKEKYQADHEICAQTLAEKETPSK